jgi:uncharacterized protein YndB with AHSA1/START domain
VTEERAGAWTRTSRVIKARPEELYAAFPDPTALVDWLPPAEMTSEIHEFDARVGGGYRMSLFYPPDERAFRGKTSDRRTWSTCGSWNWRRHAGIVEAVSFVTTDPAFFGEMTLTATFEEVSGGTEVTLMFNAGRSARGEINQREAFLPRRIGKALIERDDLERRGTMFRGYEGRCQLQCVRPTQRVHTKKSYRTLADDLAGFDLMPAVGELRQPVGRERDPLDVERSGALEAGQGRGAFHFRPPPHQHVGIPRCEPLQASRRRFGDQQRHDRRGIPKFHRPSRRSSTSASTADAPALARGGWLLKSACGGSARRGRTTPSRRSRDSLPSCSPSSPVVTGSSLATGRPRSTIRTGEPPLRPSIKALRLFLASVMLAFFIKLD